MIKVELAQKNDLSAILAVQKKAFKEEAVLCNDDGIQPMVQTLKELESEYKEMTFLKATIDKEIIGSVRAIMKGDDCYIAKLLVHPNHRKKGIGKLLMAEIEKNFRDAKRFKLATVAKSKHNIIFYLSQNYEITGRGIFHDEVDAVFLTKKNEI